VLSEHIPTARAVIIKDAGHFPHMEKAETRLESNCQTVEKLEGYRRDHEQIDRRDLSRPVQYRRGVIEQSFKIVRCRPW
jgi:hypothetical protein